MKKIVKILLFILLIVMQPLFGNESSENLPREDSRRDQIRNFIWITPTDKASKETLEINYENGCLDLIKKSIRISPHRIENWATCAFKTDAMTQGSNCIDSALHIIWRLTGIANIYAASIEATTGRIHLTENECICKNKDFFLKEGAHYKNRVAQKIFSHSRKPEHLVFYISIDTNHHAFIIEKKSDGITTWWRLYQSWHGSCTIAQWLAIDPWINQPDGINLETLFTKYGVGQKIYSGTEIASLMKEITATTEFHARLTSSDYYVKCFDLTKDLNIQPFDAPMPAYTHIAPASAEPQREENITIHTQVPTMTQHKEPASVPAQADIEVPRYSCREKTIFIIGCLIASGIVATIGYFEGT